LWWWWGGRIGGGGWEGVGDSISGGGMSQTVLTANFFNPLQNTYKTLPLMKLIK
jgi:hypothetical protein